MSDTLPIAVLIPTWNGWEDTRLCLESIARLDPAPLRVMIVDNGSTDGTPDRVSSHWPNVELLALESNEGFSRAVNRGFRALLESEPPEAVFLINNDVVLSPGVLGRMWETLDSDSGTAGVCPLITYVEPSSRVWYGGGTVALWRGYIGHRYLRASVDRVPDGIVNTDYLTGAAVLLRTGALRAVGLFASPFTPRMPTGLFGLDGKGGSSVLTQGSGLRTGYRRAWAGSSVAGRWARSSRWLLCSSAATRGRGSGSRCCRVYCS